MNAYYCEQEVAALEAVESGRWPQGCDEELRAHIAQCSICSDVVLVAQTLQQENQWARTEAALPAAGLVWWKAQMRAKREAAVRAAEPIAIVEKAAGIFGVASLVILVIWRWDLVSRWAAWVAALPHSTDFRPGGLWVPGTLASFQNFGLLIVLSASACVLLASVVLYFVFSEE